MSNRQSNKELISMALYGHKEELTPERSKYGGNLSPTERMLLHSSTPNRTIPIIKKEELSSPPFHPSEYQQQMISSNPDKFHSHFIKLRSPNKKGQTRYRCVTCSHEFECTGKLRLIQHILGSAYTGNQSKNVRSCPLPYEPLKLALLRIHGQPSTLSPNLNPPSEPLTPKVRLEENVKIDSTIQLHDLPPAPPSTSLEEGTTAEDNSKSDHDICEFLNGIGATELDFLSTDLTDEDIFRSDSSFVKRTRSEEEMDVPQNLQSPQNTYSSANKAVVQFFSNYRLPVTAVEDPLFLELLSAIRVAGPSYRPSMISLLQDTQILDKKSSHSVSATPSPKSNGGFRVHNEASSSVSRQQLQHGIFSMSAPNLRINSSLGTIKSEENFNNGAFRETFQFREPHYLGSNTNNGVSQSHEDFSSSNKTINKKDPLHNFSYSATNLPDRFQNSTMNSAKQHENQSTTPEFKFPPTKNLKQTQSLPSMPSGFSFL